MLLTLDTQTYISDLALELKDYGLNPMEWMILKDQSQNYKIRSKRDESFVFEGQVEKKGNKFTWVNLELVSI